jgi:DNA-binding MarR family transcriptional regulator
MSSSMIERVRDASRKLVRELGFMQSSLAGTDLPPSAVHALIEIDAQEGITATELADRLRLEKSSISRMLRKLVALGEIAESVDEADGRRKTLALTSSGQRQVAGIHAFARAQVCKALARLKPRERQTVLDGLRLYAEALDPKADIEQTERPIQIERGYRVGLLARTIEMHALHYSRAAGFGPAFEAIVAGGLAEFCGRLGRPGNEIWAAVEDGEIIGSVAIDAEDLGPGVAHLRWFIVEAGRRSRGVGKELLTRAVTFSTECGFSEIQLWTLAGLEDARRLYQASGFTCIEERPGEQWGARVLEQRFVRGLK